MKPGHAQQSGSTSTDLERELTVYTLPSSIFQSVELLTAELKGRMYLFLLKCVVDKETVEWDCVEWLRPPIPPVQTLTNGFCLPSGPQLPPSRVVPRGLWKVSAPSQVAVACHHPLPPCSVLLMRAFLRWGLALGPTAPKH